MRRRDLLKYLLATPLAATLDLEQLLWVPKPIVVVPALPPIMFHKDAFSFVMNPLILEFQRRHNMLWSATIEQVSRADVIYGLGTKLR